MRPEQKVCVVNTRPGTAPPHFAFPWKKGDIVQVAVVKNDMVVIYDDPTPPGLLHRAWWHHERFRPLVGNTDAAVDELKKLLDVPAQKVHEVEHV